MRARRPELFSDSITVGEPQLTQTAFEYYLNTLTHRRQETEFEYFCRRLAEKELCPNLLPQTGPTGGGDSKVDTETYPVADEIALRWYEGVGREASQERWAFAFSAKKAWRPKVRSDIGKIVNTDRDYKLVYFVTNQFVRDKSRAQVEDELKKTHNINVRILDRSWIMKGIFEHDRIRLAVETLNLTGYDDKSRRIVGPQDSEREAELQELEQQIKDPSRYLGVKYQLAEDCLQAAVLARGLELPRIEVEGRFLRAERIAEKVGIGQQCLRIAYAKAWTAFWWYEDFEELNRLYDRAEELAVGSMQATDIELLSNLWSILHTSIRWGKLNAEAAKLDARTVNLRAELERLATDRQRPNNALLARTSNLLMDLTEARGKGESLGKVLLSLKEALVASQGLAEFPLDSIAQILQDMGEFLPDSVEYDELFEVIVNLTEHRASEGKAGSVLLQRGYQKLRAGKTYDSIQLLGRAQQKLAMSEYHAEWVASMAGCSLAYEAAGLLWAARANMLMAANQVLAEYLKRGRIVPRTLKYLQKIVWLELQLGRVFHALAWIELASFIAHQLMLDGDRKGAFIEERKTQDLVLGLLLLKTDVWELKWLDFLPHILENFGLDHSWMALLFALGHEDYLRKEGVIPETESSEAIRDLFGRWLDQPASEDLPDQPELLRGERVTLRSFVLGCEVIMEVANTSSSLYLAETILGALEAFLATSLDLKGQLFPYRSDLKIYIRPSDFIEGVPEYQISEADGGQTIYIRHAPNAKRGTNEEHKAFHLWLMDLILKITLQIAMVSDLKSFAKRIARDELGFGRALNFSDIAIAIENILGQNPKFRLSDWESQTGTERFALRRTVPWNYGLKQTLINNEEDKSPRIPCEGESPSDLFGMDNLKHTDRRIVSLINLPLWEKAKWRGTAYIYDSELLPMIALSFKNPEAAKQIFEYWLNRLGQIDEDEKLRVSIITGVNKKHPSSYKVVISTNPKLTEGSPSKYFVQVSRVNQMDPPDLRNLNYFLEQYERARRYVILPTKFIDSSNVSEPFWELGIEKQELSIRSAWQIGENDQDVCAIEDDDEPIIPDGIENAPILDVLQKFPKRKKRANKKKLPSRKRR